MTNQQTEIARILSEEIRWSHNDGPVCGDAIQRLAAREELATAEELDAAFRRGMILTAKWAGIILVLVIVSFLAILPKKPLPADVEDQLQDTINIGHPRLDGPAPPAQIRFIAGTNRRMYIVWDNAWHTDTAKTPYYFNDSALLTHPGPQIVLSQKQYLDTVAAGITLYVDSAKSNDSAWVYVFKATDTLIRLDKNVNVNKL